jgi:hypothetical protein
VACTTGTWAQLNIRTIAPLELFQDGAQVRRLTGPEIVGATTRRLARAFDEIERQLTMLQSSSGEKILVGCEDFFGGCSIATNACMDPGSVYKFIGNDLRELSRRFPDTVLCPGSIYISAPIPASHAKWGGSFSQENETNKPLGMTTCYTANIMPVLHNGKIISIIRKGEQVTIAGKCVTQKNPIRGHPVNDINDLTFDKSADQNRKIKVNSYHEDNLTDLCDGHRTSTCFLGKTYLPGEQDSIKKHIPEAATGIADLIAHSHMIAGKRYLFLICGEFSYPHGTVATELNNAQDGHFDFVVHSTVGGSLPDAMRAKGKIYVHSDMDGETKVLALDPLNLREERVKLGHVKLGIWTIA